MMINNETKAKALQAAMQVIVNETGSTNYGAIMLVFDTDDKGNVLIPTNTTLITTASQVETLGLLNETIDNGIKSMGGKN